jgi:outer membrane receptor protein involved in Fe transport
MRVNLPTVKAVFLFFISLSLGSFSAASFAQESAKLIGKVTDKDTGEELIGASVVVVGTSVGAKTNIDGEFTINAKVGKVDLRVSYVGYQTRTVKAVVVVAGKTNRADIQLKTEAAESEEIVVQAEISSASENALLAQQRKSSSVQDGISAEQIKKTPDSDAAEAAKRVTGVTIVGGKFVFVRGLGERYSSSQLNGVNVPSPEPEKKVVPFDIIPANLVENLITIKTFLPDQPGNFAGGLVKIKTKEFPDQLQLSVGIGAGLNNRAHNVDIPNYPSGGTDFLGFDDGLRGLPSGFPSAAVFDTYDTLPVAQRRELKANAVSSLNNGVWLPRVGRYGLNQSYYISVGNSLDVLPLGFIFSTTYSNDVTFKEQSLFLPNYNSPEPDAYLYRYNGRIATYNVNWGGLMHFNVRLGTDSKIGLKSTYNRAAEDEVRLIFGEEARDQPGQLTRTSRLRFVARELFSNQLVGSHFVSGLAKSEIEWTLQYATAFRDEPDNRETQSFGQDFTDSTNLQFTRNGRNQRFYSTQDDKQYDALLNWSIPFNQWNSLKSKIKFGFNFSTKERNFSARRLNFLTDPSQVVVPDTFFTPQNIRAGLLDVTDATELTDAYTATEDVRAGYLMVELPLSAQWRFIGGVRVEQNKIQVNAVRGASDNPIDAGGGFDLTNFLPSLNFIYSPSEAMNFRASFSQTVAQPDMREISPFRFDDYVSSNYGNPFLEQTKIQNYDLRWEWFPRIGEIVSVSFFYKQLDKPLERYVDQDRSTVPFFTIINVDKAKNFGFEFELRKRLDFIAKPLENFSLGTNLTIVSSTIEFGSEYFIFNESQGKISLVTSEFQRKERPLQGQSPYVFNANLGYENRELGLTVVALYNIFGRRISQVAGSTAVPFNVYEEARQQVDFSISKVMFNKLTAKFNIKNILDDRYLFTVNETVEVERFKTGRVFNLSFSYNL